MNLDKAITKVAKIMGDNKFHSYMQGEMLPSGDLSAAGTIATIFNVSYTEVDLRLHRLLQVQYEKRCAEHNAQVKKSEERWKKKRKKTTHIRTKK